MAKNSFSFYVQITHHCGLVKVQYTDLIWLHIWLSGTHDPEKQASKQLLKFCIFLRSLWDPTTISNEIIQFQEFPWFLFEPYAWIIQILKFSLNFESLFSFSFQLKKK